MSRQIKQLRESGQQKSAVVQRLLEHQLTPDREALANIVLDSLERDAAAVEWLASPVGKQAAHEQQRIKLRQIEAEQRAAVVAYLLTGERKGWASESDSSGAVLLPPGLHTEVVDAQATAFAMRRLCRNITIKSSRLGVPVRRESLDDAEWTTTLGNVNEDASSPYALDQVEPQLLIKRIKVSRPLLRLGGQLAETEIISAVNDAMARPLEAAAINGNGGLRPIGLLNTPGLPRYETASSGVLTIADAKRWVGRLAARYHPGATALMHTDTFSAMLELDTAGVLFQNGLLLGRYPVELSDEFPSAGTNPASLTGGTSIAVLGDFSHFWCIDSLYEIQRLDELYAETNQVGFIARNEADAVCVRPNAFHVLTVKA